MSGLGDMWRDLAPEIGRTLGSTAAHPDRGERVILRRVTEGGPALEDIGGDGTPASLIFASSALAGATAVSLKLPTVGRNPALGFGMAGTLAAGARLTIGGTDYTLAADATPTLPAGTVLAVTLTAGLAAPAAEGAVATVHPETVFTFEDCKVHRRLRRDIARPLQADHMCVVMVPSKGAPTTPRLNDSLELEDGSVGRVANQVVAGGAFWRLQMGA